MNFWFIAKIPEELRSSLSLCATFIHILPKYSAAKHFIQIPIAQIALHPEYKHIFFFWN